MKTTARHAKPRHTRRPGNTPAAQGAPIYQRKAAERSAVLSACMIVKDEEKALPGCLDSLRQVVDEIVVYDTGSTDSTIEIARRAGARVIEGYWDDDFGRARNASLEHCRGEWVLWIDADEHFVCGNIPLLREKLREAGPESGLDALAVDINNIGDDGSRHGNAHRALRLFRRDVCCWYGSLHEQVDIRRELGRKIQVSPLVGARLDHYGYTSQVMNERGKLDRNLRMAEAELRSGLVEPGQAGIPQLNMGRALAACGRFADAHAYFDEALSLALPGVPNRTALLFSIQNLIALDRFQEAAEQAQRFREACAKKGLADYLEGVAQRRLGNPELAVALFQRVEELCNDDGFNFVDSMLRGELAGALLEAGRPGEAADELIRLVNESADITHMTAAVRVVAATGRSIEALAAAIPEDRLEKMAAALILVPPAIAVPLAEALYERFGPRPELLAAAIRFAPMVATHKALDWSARLRASGMAEACPLVAQAKIDVLRPAERLRAAITAHAAFGDTRARGLALAIVGGVSADELGEALKEASLIDPPLLSELAAAARQPAGAVIGKESPEDRDLVIASALTGLKQNSAGA